VNGKKFVLHFQSTGSGLIGARKGKLDAFALAGKHRVWHRAEASMEKEVIGSYRSSRSKSLWQPVTLGL
jgi:hypothetical protein